MQYINALSLFGNVSAGISCKLKTNKMRTVYTPYGMLVCYSEHSTSALLWPHCRVMRIKGHGLETLKMSKELKWVLN